jgi:hypothetical protein
MLPSEVIALELVSAQKLSQLTLKFRRLAAELTGETCFLGRLSGHEWLTF